MKAPDSYKNQVHYETHVFDYLNQLSKTKTCIAICDQNVLKLYPNLQDSMTVIEFESSEWHKTLSKVQDIVEQLIQLQADRTTRLIGIGGGIVCDASAFVASIYMRGLKFDLIPTTLLAMIDAAHGGKTGVNVLGYKNMIGTFNPAQNIIIDGQFLKTLSDSEFRIGLSELIKYGCIAQPSILTSLQNSDLNALRTSPEKLMPLIEQSVSIKTHIVGQDPTENGLRKLLNFGHTLGHAIEKHYPWTHGQAVAMGMVFAAKVSEIHLNFDKKHTQSIVNLLTKFNLPTTAQFDTEKLKEAIRKDKKRQSDTIDFVMLSHLGQAQVVSITLNQLDQYVDQLC